MKEDVLYNVISSVPQLTLEVKPLGVKNKHAYLIHFSKQTDLSST